MTLSVLEPYKRRGIAGQLMREVLDKAKQVQEKEKIEEIYLHVQTSNDAAIGFYKSFGFEVGEEIKDYYKEITPPDCYVLRKNLVD